MSDIEIKQNSFESYYDCRRLWLSREEFNELYDMMTEMKKTNGGLTMYFEVSGFPYEGDLRIRDAGGHIVDYSDYNTRYNDNVKEYILAAVSDYLDDIYKDLGRPQLDSPI